MYVEFFETEFSPYFFIFFHHMVEIGGIDWHNMT